MSQPAPTIMPTPDRRTARAQSHLRTIRTGVRSDRLIATVLGGLAFPGVTLETGPTSRPEQRRPPGCAGPGGRNAAPVAGRGHHRGMAHRGERPPRRSHSGVLHPAKPVGTGRRSGGGDEERRLRLTLAQFWRAFPWDLDVNEGSLFSPSHIPPTTGRGLLRSAGGLFARALRGRIAGTRDRGGHSALAQSPPAPAPPGAGRTSLGAGRGANCA